MSNVHVELGGFAGFDTVEEARAFAHAVEELLDARSDSNNTVVKIHDMKAGVNISVVKPTYDVSKVFVGLQGANARMNQLSGYAKKQTSLPADINWADLILVCVNNRYSVDESSFIKICTSNLNENVSAMDFVAGIPEEKVIPTN